MSLVIPVSVNYPNAIQALTSFSQDAPTEGRRQIAASCEWGTMGGAAKCISFNLAGNNTVNFSQISTLKIDNSACGANVSFIFPDTGEVIDVPAASPLSVVPVYSNGKSFYVYCPNATAEDVTRFIALNFYTDPANIEPNPQANFVASTATAWTITGESTQLITVNAGGGNINGTIQNLQIGTSAKVPFTGPAFGAFKVWDGAGNVFVPAWHVSLSNTSTSVAASTVIFNAQDANMRFRNGLFIDFSVLSTWPGELWINMFATYHTP